MNSRKFSRRAGVLAVAAFHLLLACGGAAQAAPVEAEGKAFVSPSILRVVEGREKDAPLDVRVIVNFETKNGRSGEISVEDVRQARENVLAALPPATYELVASYSRIAAMSLRINAISLAALRADARVYAINEDQEVHTTMIEANALTGADTVVAGGITGDGVRVAIIDTGIDSDHPRLQDDLFLQQCFRTENDCVGGASSAEDQDGHGTHVAGMITGLNGVSPDAEFAALKVFTTGSTSDTNILNALNAIITFNSTATAADKIDLVNMSLGGGNFANQATCDANSVAYVNAFATLNGQGTTIFVATGNDGQINQVGSPGCATGAVGVGSSGDAVFNVSFSNCTDNAQPDKMSCYSNGTPVQGAGEMVDLVAPGCYILSAGLNGADNAASCGTSMATPYAVGVAALTLEGAALQGTTFAPAALEDHLENNATQISDYRMPPGSPTFPRVNPGQAIGALDLDLAPSGFVITGTTATSVSMSWTAAVSGAIVEYRIYRRAGSGPAVLAGTVGSGVTSFVDNAAPCGPLTYFVRGFNGAIESLSSNEDSDTARACPLAPTNLVLTPVDPDTIDLDWVDNAGDETGYRIERQVSGGGFSPLATVGANAIAYQDDGLGCGLNQYRVIALRGGDESAPSNVVGFATCAPANDLFANAEVVAPSGPTTDTEANAKYATESPSDPIYSCHFGGPAAGFNGVWYAITPVAPTRVTVTTAATTLQDPAAGTPDTLIGIYTFDGANFSEIACNDDISGSNFRSTVSANLLDVGTTYYVFVSQWVPMTNAATGNLVVGFSYTTPQIPPPHDLVANAKVIAASPYVDAVGSPQFATTSAGDPVHACRVTGAAVGSHNVWYTFTPGASGNITLDTLASTTPFTDTILSVYTGNPGGFTSVGCNDDVSGSNFRSQITALAVNAGTKYTIQASRWSTTPTTTTGGTLALNFSFTPNPGVIVTPTSIGATEGGATGNYTVVLATQPSDDVTITLTPDAQVGVSQPTLTFTNGNWNVAQPVIVTAIDDALAEGTHGGSVSHVAASPAAAYNGIAVASVTVSITDNDSAGVDVTPAAIAATEGGATGSYDVVLTSQPTADVSITLTPDPQVTTSASPLLFTPANWDDAQTVTVTAANDDVAEGTHSGSVSHSASSDDDNYDGLAIGNVNVEVTDNDSAGVDVTPTATSATEGGATGSYDVVLTSQPTAAVSIALVPDAQVSTSASPLVFTAANWDVAQSVTVTAVDDTDFEGAHSGTISHTATSDDDGYDAIGVAGVTVDISDNDVAQPDLAATQQDDTTEVLPGDLHDYVVTVTAIGATGSVGARYTSDVPAALEDVEWTCEPEAECPVANGTGSADLLVDLDGGESLTFTITGTVADDASGELVHTVEIQPPVEQTDAVPGNNVSIDTNAVDTFANGFFDGFEDAQQRLVVKQVGSSFSGKTVELEIARLRELEAIGLNVPTPVLRWTLANEVGEIAVHARTMKGALQLRLASKPHQGRWQWGEWQTIEPGDKSLRIRVETQLDPSGAIEVDLESDRGAMGDAAPMAH
jgi:subtilisin family serine protease